MRRLILSLGLLLTGLLFTGSTAANAQKIELAYIEFPPTFYTDEYGKPKGYLIDTTIKILDHAGLEWNAKSYPPKRMANWIVRGKIDLWVGLSTLPQFKDSTLVGDSVVTTIEMRAYTRKGLPHIEGKPSLTEKRIGILRGYSYGGWVDFIKDPANQVRYIELDNRPAAYKMLKKGRVDYVLDYRQPAELALQDIDFPELSFTPLSELEARFVVSKKTPNAAQILEQLESSFHTLKASGEL